MVDCFSLGQMGKLVCCIRHSKPDLLKYNFSYGTPPYITVGHYDVPLPSPEVLTEAGTGSVKHVRAAECYIALCQLTLILGDVLPLLYHIRSGNDAVAAQQVSKSEVELRTWLSGLPQHLYLLDYSRSGDIPGLANLQLSYLAVSHSECPSVLPKLIIERQVRMLLARITWHDISSKEPDPHPSWLQQCSDSAEEVVRFALSLHPIDFRGFWLPHNSHHFTSAVTLLLRCALQTSNDETRRSCMKNARILVDFLRKAKEENDWDMAEECLATSEPVLKRIEDALSRTRFENNPYVPKQQQYHEWAPSFEDTLVPGLEQNGQFNGDISQLSIEVLFPEIFSEFTDTAMLSSKYHHQRR